ncbi:WD40 repeat domain-containing protein [Calothrix sp. PCC 6303]|uniref:WD40 repeat domain-containing protein n=1 Tax=Calothrix sp. PCC 6303 TaxID=1170562 RepID=UPI0002A00AB8|nr:WD40 repeat domain-containing protein [Calothrix sp. PCC 6303]AFZ01823.1 WD40 repeat-containing protein [Calothrix sp. PCC 6303]
MNLRKFTSLTRSSKNLTLGLSLMMLIITAACQVHGLSQQQKNHTRTSQAMTTNSQQIKPVTIEYNDKNGNPKTNFAISRDYQTLALASPDNRIQIHDTITNKLIKTLSGHNGLVNLVSWSPDDKILASASADKTIKLWNVSTGKQITTISGYSGKAADLSWVWSPDSKTIAIAQPDNTIKLWDVGTAKLIKTLTGNKSKISMMSWNPRSQTLAVWSKDEKIQLWNISTGKLLQTITEYDAKVQRIENIWSPDGKALALANPSIVKIWDVSTGKLIKTIDHGFGTSTASITNFVWSPDSKKLVSTNIGGAIIWDINTGKRIREIFEIYAASTVWSHDGKKLAVGGQEGKITIWDMITGKSQTLYGHGFFVTDFTWSPDGKILISVGMDNTIKIWDVTTGKRLKTLFGHDNGIVNIRWNPQTKILASRGQYDNAIKIWNFDLNNLVENKLIQDQEIGEKISFPAHKSSITGLVWSPDGKIIASDASEEEGGIIKFWDTSTGKSLNTLSQNQKMAVANIAWNPNGKTFATSGREKIVKKVSGNSSLLADEIQYGGVKITIWDATTGKSIRTIDVGEGDNLVWSPDGKILANSGKTNIRLWDAATGKLLKTINGKYIYHTFAWSPDGKTIVGYDLDKMNLWDVTTGKLSKTLTGLEVENLSTGGGETGNMFRAIAWSRDGKFIATTDVSRTIQIWDATAGKFVKSLTGHGSAVLDVVWSDDSKTLTSVSQDKTIKQWDVSTGKEITTIGINLPHTLRVSWSPDGKKLAAGEWFNLNNNQVIKVWDVK